MVRSALSACLLSFCAAATAVAQDREIVQFTPGESGAAVLGEITGNAWRDYVLGARAGQVMSVALFPENGTWPFFNVLAPSSKDGEAIYIGSVSGPHALLSLPESGDYAIRVYQMGDARDSGAKAQFYLSMAVQ